MTPISTGPGRRATYQSGEKSASTTDQAVMFYESMQPGENGHRARRYLSDMRREEEERRQDQRAGLRQDISILRTDRFQRAEKRRTDSGFPNKRCHCPGDSCRQGPPTVSHRYGSWRPDDQDRRQRYEDDSRWHREEDARFDREH